MFCVRRFLPLIACLFALAACDNMSDDLLPSDQDKRPDVITGTIGHMPGQIAADFTISDTLGNDFVLADHLATGSNPADAIVLYFTMWCPVCLAHTDHMYHQVIPQFKQRGDVIYALVDYVSGSVSASRGEELANGYAGSDLITLVDADQSLMDQFNGAMGTVIVIDSQGTIVQNEDYRNGRALIDTLDQQLP